MKPSLRAEPGPSVPGQPLFFTFSWLSHCLRPGLLDLAWKHLTPRTPHDGFCSRSSWNPPWLEGPVCTWREKNGLDYMALRAIYLSFSLWSLKQKPTVPLYFCPRLCGHSIPGDSLLHPGPLLP